MGAREIIFDFFWELTHNPDTSREGWQKAVTNFRMNIAFHEEAYGRSVGLYAAKLIHARCLAAVTDKQTWDPAKRHRIMHDIDAAYLAMDRRLISLFTVMQGRSSRL